MISTFIYIYTYPYMHISLYEVSRFVQNDIYLYMYIYTQASTDDQCWPIGGHESDQLVVDVTSRTGLQVLGWVHTHPQWEALTMTGLTFIYMYIYTIYIYIYNI